MVFQPDSALIQRILDGLCCQDELPEDRAVYAWRVLRWDADIPLTEEQFAPAAQAAAEALSLLGPCAVRFSEDGDSLTLLLAHIRFPAEVHRSTALWLCAHHFAELFSLSLELEGTLLIGDEFGDPFSWQAHTSPLYETSEWWSLHSTMDGPTAHKHRAALQTIVKRRQYPSMAGYVTRALRGEPEPGRVCFVFVALVIEAVWSLHVELSLQMLTEDLDLNEMTRRPKEALLAWLTSLGHRLRDSRTAAGDAPIERVIAAIQADCSLPYSQDNLSRSLGLTPAYFCRLFREKTGQHFSNFLTITRMERAQELLRGCELPLQEVSERCGYPNKSYFCQVFKKYTGMTPGEYEQHTLIESATHE